MRKLRTCLDPKHLNKAIKREHFQLPTVEDIVSRVSAISIYNETLSNRHQRNLGTMMRLTVYGFETSCGDGVLKAGYHTWALANTIR